MRRTLAAVALTTVMGASVLSGCSNDATDQAVTQAKKNISSAASELGNVQLPDVNWAKYGNAMKSRIDHWASQADCTSLRKQLGQTQPGDSDLTRYIKAQLRKAC